VREVVTASHEGGASLNILSGLTAGNFSAFWMGWVIVGLMTGAYRAVEFIKQNMKLDEDHTKASVEDSKRVVAICTMCCLCVPVVPI
jgi:K(+)-stimulated pyrophosphate-energized sodium pump